MLDRPGKLRGGAGNDKLNARDGERDTVDCGSGRRDVALVDRNDKVRSCESVKRRKARARRGR